MSHLLRLSCRCPVCGSPPALRIFKHQQEAMKEWDLNLKVLMVQCHVCLMRRKVRTLYEIDVKAFLEAS